MHPDLSSHLHSPKCNLLIEALLQCHQENKFKKFVGACNHANTLMNRCLKAEREENRKANLVKSIERQNKLKERAKEAASKSDNSN